MAPTEAAVAQALALVIKATTTTLSNNFETSRRFLLNPGGEVVVVLLVVFFVVGVREMESCGVPSARLLLLHRIGCCGDGC